ncbi:MAG: hypothetical protein JJT95_02990 [Pararhodobacter sp.]|nr:hypothetical protein [Pararhodobacter sp.]
MGPIQSYQEFVSWLRRRARLIAFFGFLGMLGGLVAALSTERVYSAITVLQVINPVVGEDGTGGGQRRAQMIEQRLMARDNLLELAERHALFEGTALSSVERVAALRQAINIDSVAAAPSRPGMPTGGALSAIIITVNLGDREVVADIANELAESVVAQSASAARERAQQALSFYRQEEERLEAAISDLEDEIIAFQIENEALLPGAMTLRRDDLHRLEESRLSLERQLSQLQGERSVLEADAGRAVSRRRIAELDEQIAQREGDMRLIDLRITQTRDRFQEAPGIARELGNLERRMEQMQAQLATIAQQRRAAELGQRIEVDEQSERFVLLEAAITPEYPVSRSRRAIAMLGAIAGLMGGVAIAFAVEAMNPVLRTAQRMERELQLRPVISIPLTPSPRETRRRRMAWVFFGAGILAAAALVLALQIMAS